MTDSSLLQTLDYELVVESAAMDAIQLLASLGGTSGLWAGLSIVTFVEILELLFGEFSDYFVRKKCHCTSSSAVGDTPALRSTEL